MRSKLPAGNVGNGVPGSLRPVVKLAVKRVSLPSEVLFETGSRTLVPVSTNLQNSECAFPFWALSWMVVNWISLPKSPPAHALLTESVFVYCVVSWTLEFPVAVNALVPTCSRNPSGPTVAVLAIEIVGAKPSGIWMDPKGEADVSAHVGNQLPVVVM